VTLRRKPPGLGLRDQGPLLKPGGPCTRGVIEAQPDVMAWGGHLVGPSFSRQVVTR